MTFRAIILSVGDELTLGQTLDTNSQWLAAQLAERSITTLEHRTIADDQTALAIAIRECCDRCELLITTGGLGPTDDDLTRQAVNDVVAADHPMIEDAQARGWLHAWFEGRGRTMPVLNARQAMRPATFRCLENANGTAPGLAGEFGRCMVFCLPGPPREMQPMFARFIEPALPRRDDSVVLTARLQEFGLGESTAAERLGNLMRRDRNPLVGTTASQSIVSARIRATGAREWAARELDHTVASVRSAWEPYVFAAGDQSLADVVGELLLERGYTLATAESCTGGWLGKSLVDRAGSSAYYAGGWITYSNQLKIDALGVDADALGRHGAVSREIALAMARGALSQSSSDCALAITGIAGPSGAVEGKPVGTVFIAAITPEQEDVRRFEFPGERSVIRDRSVKAALQMLRFLLLGCARTALIWQAGDST